MGGLRLALLIAGIVVIAVIYWQAKRRSSSAAVRNSPPASRIEPAIHDEAGEGGEELAQHQLPDLGESDAPITAMRREPALAGKDASAHENAGDGEPDDAAEGAPSAEPTEQKIISLRIAPKGSEQLAGEDVILSLRGLGLQHGKFGIFHRLDGGADDIVFSVASLVEPGSFDLQNIRQQTLPGLSIFMVRPGPGKGPEAFDQMIDAARTLARSLGGELLDGEGSTLSIQRERYIREELIEYEHRAAHRNAGRG